MSNYEGQTPVSRLILDTEAELTSLERVIWGLNDNHWDMDEILKLVFDAISDYAHLRDPDSVVRVRFVYSGTIPKELYDDLNVLHAALDDFGYKILMKLKICNVVFDGTCTFVYAGLLHKSIVMELRKRQ